MNAVFNFCQYDEISDDDISDDEISGFALTTKVPTTKFLTTKFMAMNYPPPEKPHTGRFLSQLRLEDFHQNLCLAKSLVEG